MKNLLAGLGAFVFVVGCSSREDESHDPAPMDPSAPPGASLPGASAPAVPTPSASTPGSKGGAPVGGSTPPKGTPAASPAFVGAPAYVATLGPSTIDTSGKGNGHLSFNAAGNPAGHACLSCHDGSKKGGAPEFLFAGTLYADAAGTKPDARAEVRLLGADGKGLSAYTDANGNFFFRADAGTYSAPAIAGARNATAARSMSHKSKK
jgi:hypothetical protein